MASYNFRICLSLIVIHIINFSYTLNECGSGINLCETTIKLPWTKCPEHSCDFFRKRYTLRCCGNMHKAECFKVCNIKDEDLIIKGPCSPRCVNGLIDSGICKCYNGYTGNCCGKILAS